MKRGVSPVIATVLLIALVVGLSVIVFLWFRSFTQETITKFGGQNIELSCGQLAISAEYSGGQLAISNTGNVPIYSFNVRVDGSGGNYSTSDISVLVNSWPSSGLNQGGTFQGTMSGVSGASDIVLIPVLKGSTNNGELKSYTCSDQYGYKVTV